MAETGLPGLILLLGVLVTTFSTGRRAISRLKRADPATARSIRTLLFGLIAFLQACIFASMEHLPFLYIYIALICTIVSLNDRNPAAANAPAPIRRRA